MTINIANDFSVAPGGRYRSEGPNSGEDFREKILKHAYEESLKSNQKLTVNLDGCFGFAPSFLEESFGGLARSLNDNKILNNIIIICNDQPGITERIEKYVQNALNKR